MDAGSKTRDGLSETLAVVWARGQEMKNQSSSGPTPYSRKTGEELGKLIDSARVSVDHPRRTPGASARR